MKFSTAQGFRTSLEQRLGRAHATWPPAPAEWSGPFTALAAQTGLEPSDLDTWAEQLADFWDKTRASRK
jgi:hypothetical protein